MHNPYCYPGTNCKYNPNQSEFYFNHFCESLTAKQVSDSVKNFKPKIPLSWIVAILNARKKR